jgi:hypothetical protein
MSDKRNYPAGDELRRRLARNTLSEWTIDAKREQLVEQVMLGFDNLAEMVDEVAKLRADLDITTRERNEWRRHAEQYAANAADNARRTRELADRIEAITRAI